MESELELFIVVLDSNLVQLFYKPLCHSPLLESIHDHHFGSKHGNCYRCRFSPPECEFGITRGWHIQMYCRVNAQE